MNRRGFLAGLGALVGGVLLDKAVPFGRVWSFPSEIKCLNVSNAATVYYNKQALDMLAKNFKFNCSGIHPFVAYDILQDDTACHYFSFARYEA